MPVSIGQKAPEFTLTSSDKEKVSLSGKNDQNTVLLFFPMAFTSVCTEELCGVRDSLNQSQDPKARVFGISVDSPFSLDKFKQEQQLNFPLLSDFNKEVSRAYDAIYDEFVFGMKGVSKRAAFVVDRDGLIQYAEVLDNAGELPDMEALKDTLKKLA